jgi:hypothetical protein
MKDVLIIFVVLLVLLTLISTVGGSIRQKEAFFEVPIVPVSQPQSPASVPLGLPPPPPEIAALLEARAASNASKQPEHTENDDSIMQLGANSESTVESKLSGFASMLSSEINDIMPSITNMGTPQNTLPSIMPGVEKFENFKIEAFDYVESYAIY